MKKPTGKQFFGIEISIFVAIVVWACLTVRPSLLLATIILINVMFATVNLIGASIGAATGWYPWREQGGRQ